MMAPEKGYYKYAVVLMSDSYINLSVQQELKVHASTIACINNEDILHVYCSREGRICIIIPDLWDKKSCSFRQNILQS